MWRRLRTDSYGITLTGLGGENPDGSRPDFTEGWGIKTNQLIPHQSVNHPRNKNIRKSSIIVLATPFACRTEGVRSTW
jgi:hypothetical protein